MKEIAWAAGLYEGEGTCCISHGSAIVSIVMTDLKPVQWFFETIGCGKIYGPYQYKKMYKPWYRWSVCGWSNVNDIFDKLKPWLADRRIQQFEKVLRKTRPTIRLVSEPCGFDTSKSLRAGYDRHKRNNEPACRPCLDAYKTYMKKYRSKTE